MSSTTKSYESIQLSGTGRNVERLGTMVAWLVSNNLLDPALEQSSGSQSARVRMQDLTGPAFLTTVLNGELRPAHLNSEGRAFIESYFLTGEYDTDFSLSEYQGENEWIRYDEVSPKITKAFRKRQDPEKPSFKALSAKILKFPGK